MAVNLSAFELLLPFQELVFRHVIFQHLHFGVFAEVANKVCFIEAAHEKCKSGGMRAVW